jgi:hypothetical protein
MYNKVSNTQLGNNCILARHAEWLYGYISKACGMAIWFYWQGMWNVYMFILARHAEWLYGYIGKACGMAIWFYWQGMRNG